MTVVLTTPRTHTPLIIKIQKYGNKLQGVAYTNFNMLHIPWDTPDLRTVLATKNVEVLEERVFELRKWFDEDPRAVETFASMRRNFVPPGSMNGSSASTSMAMATTMGPGPVIPHQRAVISLDCLQPGQFFDFVGKVVSIQLADNPATITMTDYTINPGGKPYVQITIVTSKSFHPCARALGPPTCKICSRKIEICSVHYGTTNAKN